MLQITSWDKGMSVDVTGSITALRPEVVCFLVAKVFFCRLIEVDE
jgi:hypothetical protein